MTSRPGPARHRHETPGPLRPLRPAVSRRRARTTCSNCSPPWRRSRRSRSAEPIMAYIRENLGTRPLTGSDVEAILIRAKERAVLAKRDDDVQRADLEEAVNSFIDPLDPELLALAGTRRRAGLLRQTLSAAEIRRRRSRAIPGNLRAPQIALRPGCEGARTGGCLSAEASLPPHDPACRDSASRGQGCPRSFRAPKFLSDISPRRLYDG